MDTSFTVLMACLALLIGMFLVKKVAFFHQNHMPEAVIGGFAVSIVLFVMGKIMNVGFGFDRSLQDVLLVIFFSSIGLSSDFARLLKGGRPFLLLSAAVILLIVVQDVVGITMAILLQQPPHMGLIVGSISLLGGHGSAGAWGPILVKRYGVTGATEMAMACATLGLIIGGMIGGPVARHLLKKVKKPDAIDMKKETIEDEFERPAIHRKVNVNDVVATISMMAICVVGGRYLNNWMQGSVLQMPTFVWCLLVGVIIRNGLTHVCKISASEPTIDVIGSTALSLFLAMALMSLQLGQLASMAGPVLLMILVQTMVMILFACFITFKIMGKDYDAVVISAGHCGFGLGATPTAIANMQAVTNAFGPSHKAFLIVPMVGAFIVDIANSILIKIFMEMGASL